MPRASDPDRLPHPGRTSAERRALDRIGCGEPPSCSPKTLRSLLDAGLIVDAGGETRRDALGSYRVPSYAMPIPVHMQWCSAVAFTDEEMAAFEAEAEARA
jgi:hypothetical protein